jgi:antitoxin component YwqK of YwqJK toxin-antitoxin module
MNRFLFLFIFLISVWGYAQQPTEKINQKDSQGRKQGTWKVPYKHVKAYRYVGQFKDDIPYGKFVYYYENKTVQAVVHFSDNGKTTRSQMYHKSGYLMAKGKYIDQKKDSTWVYYDDRGVISYQEDYKDGELDGQKVTFYAPVDGKLRVARYEYWRNGVRHGEYKEYHDNTKLKEEGKYVDGNRDGVVKAYHRNGKIMKIMRYERAVKHGPWIFYDESGKSLGIKMYWNGRLLKKESEIAEKRALWDKQHGVEKR